LINVIILIFCDWFYDRISEELTYYENPRTISEFEEGFIFKKFMLIFFSVVGPLIEITIIHTTIGLKCYEMNCYKHAQYHFSTIFLSKYIINLWKIIKPALEIIYSVIQSLLVKNQNAKNHS
jgi:hypothetical protein